MSCNLHELKDNIEKMTNYHQIEILRILKNAGGITMNENKNGTFINLTQLASETIDKLVAYSSYVDEQKQELDEIESERSRIEKTFFKDNKETRNIKL